MLKADPAGAAASAPPARPSIAARIYHAAGYWAPCDSRRLLQAVAPQAEARAQGHRQQRRHEALRRGGARRRCSRAPRIAASSSAWSRRAGCPGRAIGPFTYEGTRDDDPNDVIPHEDRRELRGARVLAAWLNHFDSREQNTMDTWMAVDAKDADASPGYVRHWYIDLGDCFGSEWAWDEISRRLGHSYYFDLEHVGRGLRHARRHRAALGPGERTTQGEHLRLLQRRATSSPRSGSGGYPNPAFARMTERDGAWAARIIARFTPEHVEAAVRVGDFTDAAAHGVPDRKLLARQRRSSARYLTRLSPIADVATIAGGELCGVDLARRTGVCAGRDLPLRGRDVRRAASLALRRAAGRAPTRPTAACA